MAWKDGENWNSNGFAARGGRAPPEFQCDQVNPYSGKRCGRWRLKGLTKCRKHGKKGKRARDQQTARVIVRFNYKMPRFYSKVLTGTLKQFVETCCDMEPHDQLALWEELALVRHSGLQSVALYNLVVNNLPEDTQEQREKKLERTLQAAEMMKSCIDQIARLSEKQANIINSSKDKVTVHNIDYAVRQVVALTWACLGDLGEDVTSRLRLLESRIRAEVKIAGTADGTLLTPDADALEMDSTVPRAGGDAIDEQHASEE